MDNKKFCNIKDVYDLLMNSTEKTVDLMYFNSTVEMMRKKIEKSDKFAFSGEEMDLQSFLVLIDLMRSWYPIGHIEVAEFIERKFKDKYTVTSADILDIISKAIEEKAEPVVKRAKRGRPKKEQSVDVSPSEKDMYKIVQNALRNGTSRSEIRKKYKLNQTELTKYEGYKYWNNTQKNDYNAMLEYRRLHPDCSNKEAIEKGCGKSAAGYRFALVPTAEQQEEYNRKFSEKKVTKAIIKSDSMKSLLLTDEEKQEQSNLYALMSSIANARNISTRDVLAHLKQRLTKDYGIVIDQVKKDLMMKYNVNRGEGKAPNALEAIIMSEYLPIAKSILEDMLTESFSIR